MSADGTITLTLPVTNTGSRSGAETVQLYISYRKASVARPAKELKGFSKVTLAPGETKYVTFTVDASALSFYDPATSSWVAEPGAFTATAAPSSGAKGQSVTFTLR